MRCGPWLHPIHFLTGARLFRRSHRTNGLNRTCWVQTDDTVDELSTRHTNTKEVVSVLSSVSLIFIPIYTTAQCRTKLIFLTPSWSTVCCMYSRLLLSAREVADDGPKDHLKLHRICRPRQVPRCRYRLAILTILCSPSAVRILHHN